MYWKYWLRRNETYQNWKQLLFSSFEKIDAIVQKIIVLLKETFDPTLPSQYSINSTAILEESLNLQAPESSD